MKKIIFILSVIVSLSACKKGGLLDDRTNNSLNEANVFTDSVRTMSFLTRIYLDEGFGWMKQRGGWENGSLEESSDDAELSLSNPARRPVIFYSSSYNADNFPGFDEIWRTPWDNIRRVNLLLSKLPTVPFVRPETKTRVEAEARFFRAWYYYNLVIQLGGMPIIKDQVFGITDVVNPPRNTFAENVAYIVSELDAVSKVLPASYTGNDYGRVTSGAALAVKAKMLLFAASPLFNGNTYPGLSTTPERSALAGYPTYSVARWQAAADAAKAVMDLNRYALYEDLTTAPTRKGYGFYSMFLKRVNSEYIFYHNRVLNRDMEIFYLPTSRGGRGWGTPTQTLVDAFPMMNGKAITDPTSGYNPARPYDNRDPRFGYSIIHNEALYFSTTANARTAVFTYVGAPNDGFVYNSVTPGPSGYFSRKMCDENLAGNSNGNTDRGWPLIRYGDILLMYAEAINETGQTELAYPPLRDIRKRAGIDAGTDGNYGMKLGMTVAEMRTFIQVERRVELMHENSRWDDARRWKISLVTQNGPNKLMQIIRSSTGTYTYNVVPSFFPHFFYERNYILPIPTSEIQKAPALLQNPGW